jgi:carbonic anhydrase
MDFGPGFFEPADFFPLLRSGEPEGRPMCNECDKPSAVDRRRFMTLAAALAGGGMLGVAGKASADECLPFLTEAQAAATADQAIQMLVDGNARYAAGQSLNCDLLGEMKATAEKQTPLPAS